MSTAHSDDVNSCLTHLITKTHCTVISTVETQITMHSHIIHWHENNYVIYLFDYSFFSGSHQNRDSIKVGVSEPGKTYVWKEQGYTSCSASCLGGVEELIINCVREDTGKVVSPFLCSPETKPEARIRTCNDRPCPPRWNYSDFSPCSKSCGIGIRERGVNFIL